MESPHRALLTVFLVASALACAALPYSVYSYVELCQNGFGASIELIGAYLYTPDAVDALVLEFSFSAPERLSATLANCTASVAAGGMYIFINATGALEVERGESHELTMSTKLSPEESAWLAAHPDATVNYRAWVDVPRRGAGSPLTGSVAATLEVVA